MKYKILLYLLKILIYAKRAVWLSGNMLSRFGRSFIEPIFRHFGYYIYRTALLFRNVGIKKIFGRQLVRRDNLQIVMLLVLFAIAIPQTNLYGKTRDALPGQNTVAYSLISNVEEFGEFEEIIASDSKYADSEVPLWKEGAISSEEYVDVDYLQHDLEFSSALVADYSAITKPTIFPGITIGGKRDKTIEYEVQPGDTVSAIALKFGVSVATILWENGLGSYSYIRPMDKLKILPVNGLTHKIVKGDTLIKLANLYNVKVENIVAFNQLKEDGSNLIIGENIVVPDGVKRVYSSAVAVAPSTAISRSTYVPPSSKNSPSISGFIWPSSARMITQYYSWRHHGLDVAGPFKSAIYASKAGTVETSSCGWNSGYGCYVVINHGGGVKTLYGHASQLLVSAGQYVKAGQTISLMGNTGRVYGRTGIHLHFEIRINGIQVNPLGYIR
ncbi:MAG: peptidoglycan DD-metalloendopeptidase family protein [bacterium]